jgi:hypothetical protein
VVPRSFGRAKATGPAVVSPQILINGPDRILLFVVDHHAVKLAIFSVEYALTPS